MTLSKRILLTALIFSSFSATLFSQDQKPHFVFELLPLENNVNAEFLENYNNGLVHYNKAVNIFKASGKELNLDELDNIQKETIAEFTLALPYFEKAYSINARDKNVVKGLAGIYFALNDTEKMNKYQKEYDTLHKH